VTRTGDRGGDRSGTTCGRWTLEERASSTLIADTYVAIGRKNARALVEVVRPTFAGDGSLAAAFRRESLATGRVRHPALPPILDDGTTDDGVPWVARTLPAGTPISAELLRDRSSKRLLSASEGGPPKSGRARLLAIADPLGDALVHAHRLGVIHGDLRPENLFREPATLLGFVGAELVARIPPEQRPIAHLVYAAPETARGEIPDARSDQFAFAAVLAAILFGGSLRPSTTVRGALQSAQDVPYRDLLWGRRGELEEAEVGILEVLARAVSPLPQERFANISEFLSALVRADLREGRTSVLASEPPESARVVSVPVAENAPRSASNTPAPARDPLVSLNLPGNLPHFTFPPMPSFPPEVAVVPPLEPVARRAVPSLLPPGTVRPVPSPLPPVPSLLPARPSSPRMQIPVPVLELAPLELPKEAAGEAPIRSRPPANSPTEASREAAGEAATGARPVSIHDAELEAARQNGPRSEPPGPLRASDSARVSRSLPRISGVQLSLTPAPAPRAPVLPWVIAAIAVLVAVVAVFYRAK